MRSFCRDHCARPGRVIPLMLLALASPSFTGCGPSRADVKKQQEQAQYHYDLAYGYFFDKKNERGEAALLEVVKSLEIKEDSADAHLLAGLIFMGQMRHLDAIRHYRRAIELKPDFYYAQNNLAAAYLATERYDEAIEVLSKLVSTILYDRKGHALNNLGWAWYKKGNLQRARQHFVTATQMGPKLCPPHNNLGMLYADQSDHEQAEKHLRLALKKCPAYAEPAYHLGRLQTQRGDFKGARESFERCLKYAGESPLADQCAERLRPILSSAARRGEAR